MRLSENKPNFIKDEKSGEIIGVSLGFSHVAEHEYGADSLSKKLMVGETLFKKKGKNKRRINNDPNLIFVSGYQHNETIIPEKRIKPGMNPVGLILPKKTRTDDVLYSEIQILSRENNEDLNCSWGPEGFSLAGFGFLTFSFISELCDEFNKLNICFFDSFETEEFFGEKSPSFIIANKISREKNEQIIVSDDKLKKKLKILPKNILEFISKYNINYRTLEIDIMSKKIKINQNIENLHAGWYNISDIESDVDCLKLK